MPNMLLVLPVILDKQDSLYIYPQGDVIVFAKSTPWPTGFLQS